MPPAWAAGMTTDCMKAMQAPSHRPVKLFLSIFLLAGIAALAPGEALDHAAHEYLVEAQLAGDGELLQERGTHFQHRDGALGDDGRSALLAAHGGGFAETIALPQQAH